MATRAGVDSIVPLIPASEVSFYPEQKGGYTPIYEPEENCSYATMGPMASVNAGVFRVYVGGAAINRYSPAFSCII